MNDQAEQIARKSKVVIIDDDPVFAHVMSHVATQNNLIVKTFCDMEEVDPGAFDDADLVVLDYDLGHTTGLEIGRHLEDRRIGAPILLVSSSNDAFKVEEWPHNMRNFAAKSLGPFGVLDSIKQMVC